MKIMALLFAASALAAFGCDSTQDVGGNDGGAGGASSQSGQGGGVAGNGQGGGGSETCTDQPCGANCLTCPPNEPNCLDPSYQGYCDANGDCKPYQPACGAGSCGDGDLNPDAEECDDGNQTDGDGCSGNCTLESPCAGKACADACLTCPPNEPNCVDPSTPGYCDIQGACVLQNPVCP